MCADKTTRKSNIASIVELFLLFLLLLAVIVVITLACMTTREQSRQAGQLTDAVICAENTAEVTKAAADAKEAARRMEAMDGISNVQVSGDTVTAELDGYFVEVTAAAEKQPAGTYVDQTIRICQKDGSAASADGGEELYRLQTGSCVR